MLKFEYITDIHLDIGKIPEAIEAKPDTILLIAGDTCELRTLRNPNGIAAFERICAAYKQVYAIVGNHEFYGEFLAEGIDIFRQLTKHIHNFQLLENDVVDLGDYLLIGTTLWTDFKNRDPMVMQACKMVMNDYNYIFKYTLANPMGKGAIHPNDTADLHDKAVNFILNELNKAEKPVIVMTHHAPLMEHCNDQRRGPGWDMINYAYATDLRYLVAHPAVVAWIHGHTHDEKVTMVDHVPLQTFARGYYRKDFVTKNLEIAPTQHLLDFEDTLNDF